MARDFGSKFNWLYDKYGDECISAERDLYGNPFGCCGKPCACLVCRHLDNMCVYHESGSGCSVCERRNEDRAHDFCLPDDEEDEDEFYEDLDDEEDHDEGAEY